MKAPKRLLILEDDHFYVELLTQKLAHAWPECAFVVTADRKQFKAALKNGPFDLILSDFSLPSFGGLEALALAREQWPDIPFVVLSGVVGDEVAVESLKAGATDYVLKDRAARLVPAIRRALHDVEETARRRQAETAHQESEALKSAIMDAALDCIIVMDHESRILEFNPAAERTFGYPAARVIGQRLIEKIMPPELRVRQQEVMLQRFAPGNGSLLGTRAEITGMRADGSEFPLEWAIVPLSLGDRQVFTAYLRDITERRRAEEKVRQVQARLEESNRDLTRRNREIQSFYHTLSHELKTPLTSAKEFISITLDGLAGPLNPTQTEYLSIAKDGCDQLQFCINDLLDATRLETGKLALEVKPVAPTPFLQRTIAAMSLKAREKGVGLIADLEPDLPEITLDEHRITQVLANLLTNAIHHTPAGGTINIRAHPAPAQPDWLQVSVSDTGRGIAKEEQDRVFDRLYQVKTGDATSEQGLGLGLYLCRELVQLHGGGIWVESAPDRGSTFSFTLPKHKNLLRPNALLIDDDPAIREITSAILGEDYNVRTAGDGVEGLSEIARQLPDIILMDLAMPRLNGPDTLREIRKKWGNSIPIIVYTAYSDGELMKQMMEHSPFTLLAKPCLAAQVQETVRRMLRSNNTSIWNRRQRNPAGARPAFTPVPPVPVGQPG